MSEGNMNTRTLGMKSVTDAKLVELNTYMHVQQRPGTRDHRPSGTKYQRPPPRPPPADHHQQQKLVADGGDGSFDGCCCVGWWRWASICCCCSCCRCRINATWYEEKGFLADAHPLTLKAILRLLHNEKCVRFNTTKATRYLVPVKSFCADAYPLTLKATPRLLHNKMCSRQQA